MVPAASPARSALLRRGFAYLLVQSTVVLGDRVPPAAVLLGLALNSALGWWWADPGAGYVLVCYAGREGREIFVPRH